MKIHYNYQEIDQFLLIRENYDFKLSFKKILMLTKKTNKTKKICKSAKFLFFDFLFFSKKEIDDLTLKL